MCTRAHTHLPVHKSICMHTLCAWPPSGPTSRCALHRPLRVVNFASPLLGDPRFGISPEPDIGDWSWSRPVPMVYAILPSLTQGFPVLWKLVKKANLNLSSAMVRPWVGEQEAGGKQVPTSDLEEADGNRSQPCPINHPLIHLLLSPAPHHDSHLLPLSGLQGFGLPQGSSLEPPGRAYIVGSWALPESSIWPCSGKPVLTFLSPGLGASGSSPIGSHPSPFRQLGPDGPMSCCPCPGSLW